jgi:hypothetical protein
MASLIYDSALDDTARALIDFDTDNFACMLVGAGYVPDKSSDTKRSAVTDEVVGTGYTADGKPAAVTVTKDTVNHRIDISLGSESWPTSTISARGAVYYKVSGAGAASDALVAYIDFGGLITSTNGTFALSASTLRLQN